MVLGKLFSCWFATGRAISCCFPCSEKPSGGRAAPSKVDSATDHVASNAGHAESTKDARGVSEKSSIGLNGLESDPSTPRANEDIPQASHLGVFAFNELRAATRNFRPDSMLGEGGFGRVFKGWIDEHGMAAAKIGTGLTVAVKQLNHEGCQGHREWLAEVNYLGQLHHPNLVKLIGYCIEDDHRLLVYEFMARGSLENHLFKRGTLALSWTIRMKIALGAAKGLAFLHGARKAVIYRDFKTSNILLDHDYTAKLSDFGLAKDGPEGDKTHVSTRVMGTYGYAAPEYVMTGHLTSKSDVYSFGVVLLEMITGRRSMDKSRPSGEHNLVEWARPFLGDKHSVFQLVDPRLDGHYPIKGMQKAAHLASECISRDSKCRPLMSEVVRILEVLQITRDMPASSRHQQSYGSYPTYHGLSDRHRTMSHGDAFYSQHRNRKIGSRSYGSPYRQQSARS
ncbi:hypothetical protein O6H91_06G120700 [Diphasiastrum complanatum]|uniref:Uncharacterized protein n=2 Tax=Diphasiastrum complanatum TaxID=34168 RepID=A0ACC2DI60_DIPCM|nr:hypothetical protein O6H91_06G120700 [Diphasiastrum complanatum]KAJ7553976.1 hypothetical protein O6H91_06G120700 [Diphasiastrum complanatum]